MIQIRFCENPACVQARGTGQITVIEPPGKEGRDWDCPHCGQKTKLSWRGTLAEYEHL